MTSNKEDLKTIVNTASGKSDIYNPDYDNRYHLQSSKLSELESELIEKSINLKPSSKYIIALKQRIEALKESISRPPEILLQHRKL